MSQDRFVSRLTALRERVDTEGVFGAREGVELMDIILSEANAEPVPPAKAEPPATGGELKTE